MTRINLVRPDQLSDQHLLAEYRELPRIVNDWSHRSTDKSFYKGIPPKYVLGTGHVKFFRNKIKFLVKRHKDIVKECLKRNFKIAKTNELTSISLIDLDTRQIEYAPSKEEIEISKERINLKIQQKPKWYKYYGKTNFKTETTN